MGRGTLAFALLFVLLPALAFVGAWLAPGGWALLLAFLGVAFLVTGFTLGIVLVPE